MKRLVLAVALILVLVATGTAGCTEEEPVSPTPGAGEEVASSCVSCHSDKDLLKEVASPEEEEKSEETTGEG